MNLLKEFAQQIRIISQEMQNGEITTELGAIRLQALAIQIDEIAKETTDQPYSCKLTKLAERIRAVIIGLEPENRVVQ